MKLYWISSQHEDDHGVYARVSKDDDGTPAVWLRSLSGSLAVAFDIEGTRQAIASLTDALAEAEALEQKAKEAQP